MGFLFPVTLIAGLIYFVCSWIGPPALAVVGAILACGIGGLAAGIAGLLLLTNFCKMNYETAFRRSFWTGTGTVAVAISSWTLDLASGGLAVSFERHLWQVSFGFACVSTVIASLTMAAWGLTIWIGKRKQRS